jgi:hypothetical protein
MLLGIVLLVSHPAVDLRITQLETRGGLTRAATDRS